jgi:hypothetical protein
MVARVVRRRAAVPRLVRSTASTIVAPPASPSAALASMAGCRSPMAVSHCCIVPASMASPKSSESPSSVVTAVRLPMVATAFELSLRSMFPELMMALVNPLVAIVVRSLPITVSATGQTMAGTVKSQERSD